MPILKPLSAALALTLAVNTLADQQELIVQSHSKPLLTIDGKIFKDLNGNGQLDPYEDWRLPAQVRAKHLISLMSLEEKAGLMLIDTLNAQCEGSLKQPDADDYLHQQFMRRFIFRNTIAPVGATVCNPDKGFRAGSSITPQEAAKYMNHLQSLAEASRLGIPVLFKSNARNHIDPDARAGINESAGAMSAFPKEAGIAAAALGEEFKQTGKISTGDMAVVRQFAEVMGKEWQAIGLRGMYGYMADLATEPRWYRVHETFSENAELTANIMQTLVATLQGEVKDGVSLNPHSKVALTIKHFPGGGPQALGLDPHYAFGKLQVYPSGGFGYHLLPFKKAVEAGVAAVMPYYGVPIDASYEGVKYPEVGFAFSKAIVTGLLREQLGFAGYVNSDTGIINDRAWGLEEKSVPERVAAAINGGTDTLSGFHDVKTITDLVAANLLSESRIDEAAERLLIPMFQMGLFENPYVDEQAANAIIGNETHREIGLDIQRKSLVLLKNQDNILPLKANSKVYILGDFKAETLQSYGFEVINGNQEQRPSAKDSDYVLISMTAKVKDTKHYRSNDAQYGLNPAHSNPQIWAGAKGYDGKSLWGQSDAGVSYGAAESTDDELKFGGAFPWEADILDFTGMAAAESWQVIPSLDSIQAVMNEVDDKKKVILHIYFRQPYVLDEQSGLRDAGAIVAGFGMSDKALLDVLSGKFTPQGKLPFSLANSRQAIIEHPSDKAGYPEKDTLYPFGFGLSY